MKYPVGARTIDRRLERPARFLWRRLTAPARSLPHFLIVGTMKSGTSSLYRYLVQHPQVFAAYRKEVHYFELGHYEGKSRSWYRAHFPLKSRLRDGAVTGEATPGYIYRPGSVELMAKLVPEAKLIVLLRDPVERTISHYFHQLRMGRENLDIEKAMEVEEQRLAEAGPAGDGLRVYMHASYKRRSIYADQIENLWRHFPRKQVLVQGSGSLFKEPSKAVTQALEFLGIEQPMKNLVASVKNKASNRTEVSARLRQELEEFFAPHNERLFKLLGGELDW